MELRKGTKCEQSSGLARVLRRFAAAVAATSWMMQCRGAADIR
jgi:hypothetical protein